MNARSMQSAGRRRATGVVRRVVAGAVAARDTARVASYRRPEAAGSASAAEEKRRWWARHVRRSEQFPGV